MTTIDRPGTFLDALGADAYKRYATVYVAFPACAPPKHTTPRVLHR